MFHVSKALLACQPVPGEFRKYRGGTWHFLSVIFFPLPKYFTLGFYFLKWSYLWNFQTEFHLVFGRQICWAGIEDLAETTLTHCSASRFAPTLRVQEPKNQHMGVCIRGTCQSSMRICKVKNASATKHVRMRPGVFCVPQGR